MRSGFEARARTRSGGDAEADAGAARRARRRKALQVALAIFGLIPMLTSVSAFVLGPEGMPGGGDVPPSVDNEYRFLAVYWFGSGVAIYWAIPRIERVTGLFRFVSGIVVLSGIGRLLSTLVAGTPHWSYVAAMLFELIVVPAVIVWQATIAER
jgi:hypothetical protein